MVLKIFDIFTTIIQTMLIAWSCNNMVSRGNRLSKNQSGAFITIVCVNVIFFTYSSIYVSYANLFLVLGSLIIVLVFYRKAVKEALLGFSIVYLYYVLVSFVVITIYKSVILKLNLSLGAEMQLVLFVFLPVYIFYYLFYANRRYIFNFISKLKTMRNTLVFIMILNYAIIILDTVRAYLQTDIEVIYNSLMLSVIFLIFVSIVFYFASVNHKSNEVERLNIALTEKITELKKIKHDYGSEISSLYGLYQLGKTDRVGELLKQIIERNQSVNTSVSVNLMASPMVASIISNTDVSNINVVVNDNADYENISIRDNELVKLISNIIKNSEDALKNTTNAILKFISYNSLDEVVIIIGNNGPIIPKKVINRIFETGFSTKEKEQGQRGYGLSIVKEILEKYKGIVEVNSDNSWTEFKLHIPYETKKETDELSYERKLV